jgi:hypothetical protein
MNPGLILFVLAILALLGVTANFANRKSIAVYGDRAGQTQPSGGIEEGVQSDEVTSLTRDQQFALLERQFDQSMQRLRLITSISISAVILAAALYILLTPAYIGETQKWAVVALGTVIGYWLKN